MIIVYIWRSGRSNVLPAGHASLVVCPSDRSKPDTVCTWFGALHGGSSSAASGSRNASAASHGGAARHPTTPLQEWGPGFVFRGSASQFEKVQRFANEHPDDPIAQLAARDVMNTQMYPPSDEVIIRTFADPGSYVGLVEDTIRQWWHDFTTSNNHYSLARQNCSTITAGALIAGGGTEYASTPAGSSLFWSPDKVFPFAREIKQQVDRLQRQREAGALKLDELAKKVADPGDVWTRDQWYAASEENVSWASRRYQLLKDVDSLLESYHHDVVLAAGVTEDFKSEMVIRTMSQVEAKLAQILAERPSSKRQSALGKLAAQCRRKKQLEHDAINSRREALRRAREERAAQRAPLLDQQLKLMTTLSRVGLAVAKAGSESQAKFKEFNEIREQLAVIKHQLEALPAL